MKKRIAIFTMAFLSIAAITVVIVVMVAVFSNEGAFSRTDEFVPEAQVELSESDYCARIEAASGILNAERNPRYQLSYTITHRDKAEPDFFMTLEADSTVYRANKNHAICYYSNENSGIYRYLPGTGPYAIYQADDQYYSRSQQPVDNATFESDIGLKTGINRILTALKDAYGMLEFTDGKYRASAEHMDNADLLVGAVYAGFPLRATGLEIEFNRSRFYCYRLFFDLEQEADGISPGAYTATFTFTALNNRLSLPAEPGQTCSTADCSDFW